MLLRERGIELTENRNRESGAFTSSITAEVSGSGQRLKAGVTVFGNNIRCASSEHRPDVGRLRIERAGWPFDGGIELDGTPK